MTWLRRTRQWVKKWQTTSTVTLDQLKPFHSSNRSPIYQLRRRHHHRGKLTPRASWQMSTPRQPAPRSTPRAALPCSHRWWSAMEEISTRPKILASSWKTLERFSILPRALGSQRWGVSQAIRQLVYHRLHWAWPPRGTSDPPSFIQIWSQGLLRPHMKEIYLPKLLAVQ